MRRSVVDEVFEAHEAQLLGEATSGFKSWTADVLQRGWVVPGFRERLIYFYEAVARVLAVPGRQSPEHRARALDPRDPIAIGEDPFVNTAWDNLLGYFHTHQEKLLKLYPGMGDSLVKKEVHDYFLNKARKHALAVSARQNVGARTGRGWANNQLASWARRA